MVENKYQTRFLYLDALRGIAAIFVVLYHYIPSYNEEFEHVPRGSGILSFGYYGVELFFLISGFVIFYTLSKAGSVPEFLMKRAIRLYPTYWVCLIVTFIVLLLFPLSSTRSAHLKDFLYGLTMFNGLFKINNVDPSYWTLLIEWFFYLMLAVSMLFLRTNKIAFYIFLWFWLALILFYQLVHKIPGAGAFFNLHYGSFFVSGICCYEIYLNKVRINSHWLLLVFSFGVSLIALRDLDYSNYVVTIVYLMFLSAIHFQFVFLSFKPLLFLGEISYALYLIHQNVGFVIIKQLEKLGITSIWKVLIALAVVILIATLITRNIEKPLSIKLRKLLKH